MSNNTGSGSVLVAFVLGAMAGAAVALLYAPATGEETRRKLAEKAREGRDKAVVFARRGREAAEDLARRGREAADDLARRGREAFEAARKETL
jgi:gas vesicle protein